MFDSHRLSILTESGVLALAGFLIFVAPYQFPPTTPLLSPSYVFGFNNRIAILALAATVITLALLRSRRWAADRESRDGMLWDSFWQHRQPFVVICAALAGWYLLLTLAIYFLVAKGSGFYKLDWESSTFLWHLRLMDLYHLRPYIDFRVEYGPALVYLPYWFYRAVQPFGISHEPAYYALHYMLNVMGLLCLAAFMAAAKAPVRYKRVAFALLGISAFAPQMGLNGLALRYLAPYFSLLAVHIAVTRGSSRRVIFGALAAAVSCFVNVSLSAEIGVAYFVAAVAYGLLVLKQQRTAGILVLGTILGFGVLLRLALPAGYFQTFSSFSQGANNFPIVPAPHILLYLTTVVFFVPGLLAAPLVRNDSNSSLLCGLGLLSLGLMPGALGRCDPHHVIFYGLGLFVLAFLLAAHAGRIQFIGFAAAYTVVFICGLQWSNARVYGVTRAKVHLAGRTVYNAIFDRKGVRDETPGGANTTAPKGFYTALSRFPAIGLPYGSYGYEKQVQRFLWSTKRLVPEPHMGTVGVYTEADLKQRLSEVSLIPRIMILKSFLKLYEHRDTCLEKQNYLRISFLYPGAPPCLHAVFDTDIELSKYIEAHYRVLQRIGDYYIMERVI
jgi:hypothetical protein